jgi:hypothetical protein
MYQINFIQEIQTGDLYSITFFFRKLCRLSSNVEKYIQPDRPQTTIWRMRTARWVPKTTDTHSVYAKLTALPVQQRFNERGSMLGYSYKAKLCLYWLMDDVLRTAIVSKVSGEMYAPRTKRKTCISAKIPVCTHMLCIRL